ncbi:hypothetical protein [Thiobacillus denitrificans]|uniref:DUF4381 domain-containing protein n=1 Tax=Thiobacillus denitrificans TaxID=36861 RepID=A0A119CWV1_THIDE|nr:hypothetical protein [Thiobacillus denitrificans]KVW97201.1 hypothetical protein ABW22_05140 [Thiobacillus denitrificans]
MADPRNELADIIVPAAPDAVVAAAGTSLFLWTAVGLAGVAGVALLAWLWHRRRPARALHAIAAAAAQRQSPPPVLAARLDAWVRARFLLPRVDAAICPPGLDPVVWSDWAKALAQLRFAPPPPDGYTVLVSLCERARHWSRHA